MIIKSSAKLLYIGLYVIIFVAVEQWTVVVRGHLGRVSELQIIIQTVLLYISPLHIQRGDMPRGDIFQKRV